MPQAYLVVWCINGANREVLLATKRFLSARFGGVPTARPVLLNSAGQACFPGGNYGGQETLLVAAQREFAEETGVDFRTAAHAAAYHVIHTHAHPNPPGANGAYGAVYVQLAGPADLVLLQAQIGATLAADTQPDQELAQVEIVTEAAVAARLGRNPLVPTGAAGDWYNPLRIAPLAGAFDIVRRRRPTIPIPAAPTPVSVANQDLVTAQLDAPSDWYLTIIQELPQVAAAAALAAPVVAAVVAAVPPPPPAVAPPPVHPPVGGPLLVRPPQPVNRSWNIGCSRQVLQVLGAVAFVGLAAVAAWYSKTSSGGGT